MTQTDSKITKEFHVSSSGEHNHFDLLWALLFTRTGKAVLVALPSLALVLGGLMFLSSRAASSEVLKLQNALVLQKSQTEKAIQEHREKIHLALRLYEDKVNQTLRVYEDKTNKAIQDLRVGLRELRINLRADIKEALKDALEPIKERIQRNERMIEDARKRRKE
ncbi:MAG: hypothetical protein H6727_09305 [Myxococcales bacterium]|nr:hypothetical protein [Myxococcales bacterium]